MLDRRAIPLCGCYEDKDFRVIDQILNFAILVRLMNPFLLMLTQNRGWHKDKTWLTQLSAPKFTAQVIRQVD